MYVQSDPTKMEHHPAHAVHVWWQYKTNDYTGCYIHACSFILTSCLGPVLVPPFMKQTANSMFIIKSYFMTKLYAWCQKAFEKKFPEARSCSTLNQYTTFWVLVV